MADKVNGWKNEIHVAEQVVKCHEDFFEVKEMSELTVTGLELIIKEIEAVMPRARVALAELSHVVTSEELEELFEICDQLHVLHKGHLSPALPTASTTVQEVGAFMIGAGGKSAVDPA